MLFEIKSKCFFRKNLRSLQPASLSIYLLKNTRLIQKIRRLNFILALKPMLKIKLSL